MYISFLTDQIVFERSAIPENMNSSSKTAPAHPYSQLGYRKQTQRKFDPTLTWV